jgi:hypothetical protein
MYEKYEGMPIVSRDYYTFLIGLNAFIKHHDWLLRIILNLLNEKNEMLFTKNRTSTKLKTMEFTATSIKTFQYGSQGPSPLGEITFKSDCTEYKHGLSNGPIINIQTYCHQDASKEKNLVFPTTFIKFFKLLGSSESGRKFWFDEHKRSNFDEAGIDTNYDAEFGDICSGDNKSDLMRYIYRDMVVPFTKLEKENRQLRKQLESKDRQHKSEKLKVYYDCVCEFQEELEEKDQQLNTRQEELEEKDQEIEDMKKQLDQKDQELKIKHDKYLSELLKVSTLKFALEAKDEELQEKDQEIQLLKEQLNIKYHDYLLEIQEEFEEKDQEIEEKEQELKTRGLLLKSCVDDLKICIEKVEYVEKKNQKLEHLNHRLICECERKTSSYFGPEM